MSELHYTFANEEPLWENAFFSGIGTYISLINQYLSTQFPRELLGNHIKILGGYAFKSTEYKTSGIPIIRISDFNNERINLKDVVYYDESENLKRFELSENDILIAMTGGTIGKLAIVQHGLGKLYLNQRVGKFSVINPIEFEQEYIYWLARGVQDKVKNLAWGGSQPNVSSRDIEQLKFPIPDKTLQKRIISFLNDVRGNHVASKEYFHASTEQEILRLQHNQVRLLLLKHELTHQQALLTKLREAILREAVQGKLTHQKTEDEDASHLLARIKAEKAAKGIKEKPLPPIKPEELPYELPQGWVWCRLEQVVINRDGERVPISSAERTSRFGEYDYYGASGVIDKIDDYLYDGQFLLLGEDGANLIARSTPVAFIASGRFWVNNHAHVLQTIDDATLKFLEIHINAIDLKPYITGGFQPKLSQGKMNQILIALPPLAEQERIVAVVERLLGRVAALEQEVLQEQETLGRLMQSALREVFGGGTEEEQPSTESEKFF